MPLSEGATRARQARRLLQRVLDFAPVGMELRTVVRIGRRAAEGIIELAAEDESDLIIFGWGGKPGGKRGTAAVFSPTIDEVVRDAPCNIAVVKQRGVKYSGADPDARPRRAACRARNRVCRRARPLLRGERRRDARHSARRQSDRSCPGRARPGNVRAAARRRSGAAAARGGPQRRQRHPSPGGRRAARRDGRVRDDADRRRRGRRRALRSAARGNRPAGEADRDRRQDSRAAGPGQLRAARRAGRDARGRGPSGRGGPQHPGARRALVRRSRTTTTTSSATSAAWSR